MKPRIPEGFAPKQARVLKPNETKKPFQGKVAVLMEPHVISGSESFLFMMKAAGATLMGERSFRSSGNPKAIRTFKWGDYLSPFIAKLKKGHSS